MARTYAQGMAYELARELISAQIGSLSHQIGIEEAKLYPVQTRITKFEARIIALGGERERLTPEDDAAIEDVIQRYARDPYRARLALNALQSSDEP